MDSGKLKTVAEKTRDHLVEHGLRVVFRVRNAKVDYTITNRPEPTVTGIGDDALATAIVDAVQRFEMKRVARPKRFTHHRDDGREVVYKDRIDINWVSGTVQSSVAQDLTMKVMSIVVQNLMREAMQAQAREEALKRAKGGLN